jgi:predicted metal-dependent phosphoesterase TrpH
MCKTLPEGWVRADLHCHTVYSKDSLTSLEAVIRACQRRGIHRVAITGHNTVEGALRLRDLAPEMVIVGEEIKTTHGEIQAFFIERLVPPGLSPEKTIACIREQGGVVGVSHPLDPVRSEAMGEKNLRRIVHLLDCIEVFNARTTFAIHNRRAAEFARQHGLPGTAGSDAHTAFEIGRAYVEMPAFDGPASFLEALAQGRIVGRESWPVVHLFSRYATFRKRLRSRR